MRIGIDNTSAVEVVLWDEGKLTRFKLTLVKDTTFRDASYEFWYLDPELKRGAQTIYSGGGSGGGFEPHDFADSRYKREVVTQDLGVIKEFIAKQEAEEKAAIARRQRKAKLMEIAVNQLPKERVFKTYIVGDEEMEIVLKRSETYFSRGAKVFDQGGVSAEVLYNGKRQYLWWSHYITQGGKAQKKKFIEREYFAPDNFRALVADDLLAINEAVLNWRSEITAYAEKMAEEAMEKEKDA